MVRAITVFFTDMNSSLNLALCESIVSPFLSPERLVMEHAMLVAYLHCNVGTEVGECMGWELELTRNLEQIRLTVSARDRRFYPVKFKVIDHLLHKCFRHQKQHYQLKNNKPAQQKY